jgi:hypothetical protein
LRHLCKCRTAAESREIDGSILALFDLSPAPLADELLLLGAWIPMVAVLADASRIRGF